MYEKDFDNLLSYLKYKKNYSKKEKLSILKKFLSDLSKCKNDDDKNEQY